MESSQSKNLNNCVGEIGSENDIQNDPFFFLVSHLGFYMASLMTKLIELNDELDYDEF